MGSEQRTILYITEIRLLNLLLQLTSLYAVYIFCFSLNWGYCTIYKLYESLHLYSSIVTVSHRHVFWAPKNFFFCVLFDIPE